MTESERSPESRSSEPTKQSTDPIVFTTDDLDALLEGVVKVPAVTEDDCPWCLGHVKGRGVRFTIIGFCPPDHFARWHLRYGLDGALFRRAYEDDVKEEEYERAVIENRLDEAKKLVRAYVAHSGEGDRWFRRKVTTCSGR